MAIIRAGLFIRTCATVPCGLLAICSTVFASDRAVPLADRIHGAEVVVVATPASVTATWNENAFGDRLIVSRYMLQVGETLKGRPTGSISLDLDGGTLDGVTLRVSSQPLLEPGERAVFFLDAGNGAYRAHFKGLGILKLDGQDVVRGSSLTLDEIRRVAASVGK